jgi:hypothetical protein
VSPMADTTPNGPQGAGAVVSALAGRVARFGRLELGRNRKRRRVPRRAGSSGRVAWGQRMGAGPGDLREDTAGAVLAGSQNGDGLAWSRWP